MQKANVTVVRNIRAQGVRDNNTLDRANIFLRSVSLPKKTMRQQRHKKKGEPLQIIVNRRHEWWIGLRWLHLVTI